MTFFNIFSCIVAFLIIGLILGAFYLAEQAVHEPYFLLR